MSKNSKTKWWLGAILYIGFLFTFLMDLTGLSVHQWLGIFIGILILYHLITHLDWVNAVAGRLFGGTNHRSRLYLLIDILLACGFGLIVGTGLLMSTWFRIPLANYEFWRINHILFSIGTLLVIALKLLLHWRWIAATIRKPRMIKPDLPTYPSAANVSANPSRMCRRQFLGVAGVIGIGTLVAARNAIRNMDLLEDPRNTVAAREMPVSSQTTPAAPINETTSTPMDDIPLTPDATPTSGPAIPTAIPTTCFVRCDRRCSYPGQCRRYVDLNNNRLCDNGECI